MGTGQMFLVLLAVMLFSSIILTTQNNLFTLAFSAYEAMISMQGYKIADRYLQEIEAAQISGAMSFEQIYNTFSFADSLIRINQVDYFVTSTTRWVNQYGGTATDSLHQYMRVDLRINGVFGSDTVVIGHGSHPISFIYAEMGM